MNLPAFYEDKVVLITGGSMGIGKEMARLVMDAGGKVILTGRRVSKLLAAGEEFREFADNLVLHTGDVADYQDTSVLMDKITNKFGRLDILVNNAGMAGYGEVGALEPQAVDEVIDTNIKGSIFQTRAALPLIKKSKGSILFVSSVAGFWGLPAYSLYSLSKMALTALVQSLRLENAKDGVYAGIAYVCFTENEKEKRWLSPEGNRDPLPQRNKLFLTSRSDTARKMLVQIARRKPTDVHSGIGKLMYIMSRFIPGIVNWILIQFYKRQKKPGFL
ncbi:MAG TPA: SDR family oxidoreductase [Chloroflexi bacterium]|nr:SDR family oxidoreductase [Chloroflexota bacterium]